MKEILRIIDANLNRSREALRVCEDVARFVIEDKDMTFKLKNIRHEVFKAICDSKKIRYASLVLSRDAVNDVGKRGNSGEFNRIDAADVLSANLERAKESIRALEESSKTIDKDLAVRFKRLRFKIYDVEKVLMQKL